MRNKAGTHLFILSFGLTLIGVSGMVIAHVRDHMGWKDVEDEIRAMRKEKAVFENAGPLSVSGDLVINARREEEKKQ